MHHCLIYDAKCMHIVSTLILKWSLITHREEKNSTVLFYRRNQAFFELYRKKNPSLSFKDGVVGGEAVTLFIY